MPPSRSPGYPHDRDTTQLRAVSGPVDLAGLAGRLARRELMEKTEPVTTYTARVERGEQFWLVTIPEIQRTTQARTSHQVEPMARDPKD
jgi:hypothetical protein